MGALSNSVVTQWNTVMEWVMADGLTTSVQAKLDTMATDGTLSSIINVQMLGSLSDLQTTAKDNLVHAINELFNRKDRGYGDVVSGLVSDGVTDNATTLQAAITAASGKKVIIPDGTYLLGSSILVPSDIEIELSHNVILKAKDGMNVPFFKNDYTLGNQNIFIHGGQFDGNSQQQTGNTCVFQFKNVKGLWLQDIRIKNTYGLATNFGQIENFLFENFYFDQDGTSPNQDGIHVCGYARNGVIRNISGVTYDDMVALNADDGVGAFSTGEIKNVVVDGVQSPNGYRLVRLLSSTNLMDRITVRNLNGDVSVNLLEAGNNGLANGKGNFGRVDIENVQGVGQNGFILLNGSFDVVNIDNVRRSDALASPTIQFTDTYRINTLHLSNLQSKESNTVNGSTTLILDGSVGTLFLDEVKVEKTNSLQRAFLIRNGVEELFASDVFVKGGNHVFEITDPDTVIGQVFLTNVKAKGIAGYLFVSDVSAALVEASNLYQDGGLTLFRFNNTAGVRLKGMNLSSINTSQAGRGNGKKEVDFANASGISIDGDVSVVDFPGSPNLFDRFLYQGTHATLHQGYVVWNGTNFINLADGSSN